VAEEEGWWEAEDSPEVITASEGWSGDFDEFTSNFDGLLSDMQNGMAELGDGDVSIEEVRALADAQVESRIGSLPFSDSKKRAARRIWRAKADKTQFASDELEAEAFERTHERRRRVYGIEDPRKLKGANTDDDDEPWWFKGFIIFLFILMFMLFGAADNWFDSEGGWLLALWEIFRLL
jgi:hypothetical protein